MQPKISSSYRVIPIVFLLAAPAAMALDPYEQPDNTWISVSGRVETVTADSFTLDYGDGIVAVEMDDGDRDADAYKLVRGDQVTVNGIIDDDLFETTTIEASSVYVETIKTYFYASSVDEEDTFVTVTTPVIVSNIVVQGKVTKVGDEEFTVDTGLRSLTVDVDELPINPLDEEGYQQIEVGDRVSVAGDMDKDFFEGRKLVAEAVVTLTRSGS
ncbi:DUF5666 domain-containing protein [Thiococcus pfennigii]|uniref:DUF5666 domain-containing protein n=1 Tax=Thiococcus pfennigii TaxID=1057 RepID=UPI00190539F7|nr:DUF5666 domain-containing protein [Thiococcus pfennigii]MBK1732402.1 hypothetical protein [Thiococcus pfennigii]